MGTATLGYDFVTLVVTWGYSTWVRAVLRERLDCEQQKTTLSSWGHKSLGPGEHPLSGRFREPSSVQLNTHVLNSFRAPVSGARGCIVDEQQKWTIAWNWGRHAGMWLQYHTEIKKRDAG